VLCSITRLVEVVGLDMGLLHFATLDDGSTIENPRYYRRTESSLQAAQQALSRKKRRSARRRKQARLVGRHHRRIRNQRRDFHHKEARKLVNGYQVIVFEKLQPKNMSRRPKPKPAETPGEYLPNGASAKAGLNKSILDAGWGQFQQLCVSKAEWAGSRVLFVDPQNTSQRCSGCGTIVPKDLDERWHSCPQCGLELDRDHNSAASHQASWTAAPRTRTSGTDGAFRGRASEKPPALAVGSRHCVFLQLGPHDHIIVMLFEFVRIVPPLFPRNARKVCCPFV